MIVAIPIFGTRISPRFDCAPHAVLFDLAEGTIRDRREESIAHLHWRSRITFLVERKVDVLLCGGIRRCDFFFLAEYGIDVHPGLVGAVDDVLNAFIRGEISHMKTGERSPAPRSGRRRGPGRGRQS